MDRLPQEIYDAIATYFSDAWNPKPVFLDRASLATVSRKWQAAIERRNFEQIQLNSTPFDLEHFQNIVRGDRRRFVKKIFYSIILPIYSKADRGQFEQERDRRLNNKTFTLALQNLFSVLRSWRVDAHGHISDSSKDWGLFPMTLVIEDIYSPMDDDHRGPYRRFARLSPKLSGPEPSKPDRPHTHSSLNDLGTYRYEYSFLDLQQDVCLPVLSGIGSLLVNTLQCRKMSPKAIVGIISVLPDVDAVSLDFIEPGERYPAFRRAFRDSLTSALRDISLPKRPYLLRLNVTRPLLANNLWCPVNLLPVGGGCEAVGMALREKTAQDQFLQNLHITDSIEPSLLWPTALKLGQNPEPFWQGLESLLINFDLITPAGCWYFKIPDEYYRHPRYNMRTTAVSDIELPPGHGRSKLENMTAAMVFDKHEEKQLSGRSPPHRRRTVPDNKQLGPLIEAFAKACSQMPRLRQACLATQIWSDFGLEGEDNSEDTHTLADWGIYYAAPFSKYCLEHEFLSSYFAQQQDQRRLVLDVRAWRPRRKLLEILRGIGVNSFGGQLSETYVDTWKSAGKLRFLQRKFMDRKSR